MTRRPPRSTLFPYTPLSRSTLTRFKDKLPGKKAPPLENRTLNYIWFGGELPDRYVANIRNAVRSEEHTSELQSRQYLVCRLLLEKKKKIKLILQSRSQQHHH